MRKLLLIFTFIQLLFVDTTNGQNMFDICPLKVGERVPNLEVQNLSGSSDSIHNIIEHDPTILVFFRGGWCGYCTRHLSALQIAKDQIDSLGFRMIAITPDRVDSLQASIGKTQLEYELYADSDMDLIDAFGLSWQVGEDTYVKYRDSYGVDLESWSGQSHHKLPVPAIYIIQNGVVSFQYVNPDYSQRLEPKTLIAILEALQLN